MIVVDACIAVKWFLSENYSQESLGILAMDEKLIGPRILANEVAGAFVHAFRRGDIPADVAIASTKRWLTSLGQNVVRIEHEDTDISRAAELACELRHPIADCIYLALAERLNAPLVTADTKLCEKVAGRYTFVNFIGGQMTPVATT